MPRARLLCCALLLASCASPSRVDPPAAGAARDPWAAGSNARDPDPSDRKAGGFDLQGAADKIAESLAKPGPYEAPRQSKGYDQARPHWGVIHLHGNVVEREALSFTGDHGVELRQVIDRLREFARTDALRGVIVRVEGLELSLPDAVELRAAIHDVRAAGKQIACHAENARNAAYLVLAACDRIGLAPLGEVAITGPTAMPIHVKPLLDKLGIQADFLHVGAYKGAAEPLTRDAPSKEMEETLGAILDRRYQTMVDIIAAERKLAPAQVQALIDTGLFPAEPAKAARLVDEVVAFEAFRDATVAGAAWVQLTFPADEPDRLAMIMKVSRFLGAIPPDKPLGDHVAVAYAIGDIVDGAGDGVLGARAHIASHTLVAALGALAADDTVKAVVLRIDSGGGSAQASELIWRAVAELKAKKPVIVSMSDVAASGGYYIASGATKIFALEDTLTGSIGVVGGKLAPEAALAKLGVRAFPMGRGKRATMMASFAPWTADERAAIQGAMEAVYQVFVGRVADGRHKPRAAIQAIAEGRVWTGAKAKELGLVDALGGLDAALAEARTLGKVDASTALEIYPSSITLRDLIAGYGEVHAPFGVSTEAVIAALGTIDPRVALATEHLVRLVFSFRSSTIQAVAMLPVMP
ncbi:MAG: signal peptide peptidase SppA [Kofleriaceae bacterium]